MKNRLSIYVKRIFIVSTLSTIVLSGCGNSLSNINSANTTESVTEAIAEKTTSDSEAVTELVTEPEDNNSSNSNTETTKAKKDETTETTEKTTEETTEITTDNTTETNNNKAKKKSNDNTTKNGESVEILPINEALDMYFSSGAGGWYTSININPDGSFTGVHIDSEMGDMAENFPNGTVYQCIFHGTFSQFEKLDDNTYRMKLDEVNYEDEVGREWIEDDFRYVASTPYGIIDGEYFIFYLPETKVANLDEMFLSWWPGRFETETKETLDCYGLYNINTECGFFSY